MILIVLVLYFLLEHPKINVSRTILKCFKGGDILIVYVAHCYPDIYQALGLITMPLQS
jgi:hypothetical protein